jgi:hypothetical protein
LPSRLESPIFTMRPSWAATADALGALVNSSNWTASEEEAAAAAPDVAAFG